MSNGLAGASGLIGTAVGLGVTVGVLGLTLGFLDRSLDRATPRRNGGKQRRRQSAGLFDFGGQTTSKRRSRQPDIFGGNLF